MDVYLIPVGPERYEPYCEKQEQEVSQDDAPSRGVFRRLWDRFQQMLHAAERAQRDASDEGPHGWTDRLMRWVAEKVAEQRLLWQLRRQEAATLHFASDLPEPQATAIMREHLARDADRHRRWMVIDGVLTAITGPLFFFVPGPNLVAYYFAFRAVGHYLSRRGARHGLDVVRWGAAPSAALTDLRRAIALDDDERSAQVHRIAEQLQLPHLALFVERVAPRRA